MRAEHGALQWNQRAEKERERRQPAPHGQTAGVGRALETNDDIVGVAHDGFSGSPSIGGRDFLTRRARDGVRLPFGHADRWRGLTACHRPGLIER